MGLIMNNAENRIEEFVAKVGLFARQYPEFKHNVCSKELPHCSSTKTVDVVFTAPNGKEQVAFCTMIDSVYNPYGEKEFDVKLYQTLIKKLDDEFAKILSEKKND